MSVATEWDAAMKSHAENGVEPLRYEVGVKDLRCLVDDGLELQRIQGAMLLQERVFANRSEIEDLRGVKQERDKLRLDLELANKVGVAHAESLARFEAQLERVRVDRDEAAAMAKRILYEVRFLGVTDLQKRLETLIERLEH